MSLDQNNENKTRRWMMSGSSAASWELLSLQSSNPRKNYVSLLVWTSSETFGMTWVRNSTKIQPLKSWCNIEGILYFHEKINIARLVSCTLSTTASKLATRTSCSFCKNWEIRNCFKIFTILNKRQRVVFVHVLVVWLQIAFNLTLAKLP